MEERKQKLIRRIVGMRPKGRPPQMDFYESGMIFVLNFLYDNKEKEIIAGDIAKKLDVSTARVAKLLSKLTLKELIYTYPLESDKRKTVVCLTEKGKLHTQRKRKEHDDKISNLIDKVGIEDMETFVNISEKIIKAFEEDRRDSFDKDL